jgi:hypothetical protein
MNKSRNLFDAIQDGLEVESMARKQVLLGSLYSLDSGVHEENEASGYFLDDSSGAKGYFVDDGTGVKLSDKLVNEGRALEMKTFREMNVYTYVLREDVKQMGRGKVVGVRWVDVLKGDIVRSRLVAQEFAGNDDRDDLFAATPPLSASKYILSEVASRSDSGTNSWRIMVLDVKRAFLYGYIEEEIFIELPPEDPMYGKGYLGKLVKAMYGTRAAPQVWQKVVREVMLSLGFKMNPIFPCVYYHAERDVTVRTHVDDFLCGGEKKHLKWLQEMLSIEFDLKCELLGKLKDEVSEVSFLGRMIRITNEGIEFEGDPKHSRILLDEWKMENSRSVSSPGTADEKANLKVKKMEEALVDPEMCKPFRRAAARINYMALDRADLAFSAKEVSRGMANPSQGDVVRLKRVIRYLMGSPRVVNIFRWQQPESALTVYSDSDWAGCAKTRKSSSGGMILRGGHLIAHWASTQATVALSSAEAELSALVKAISESLGIMNMLKDMGKSYSCSVFTDSSAANGIVHRLGAGKIKHLEARQLWVQNVVADKEVLVKKIPRDYNLSDALTHNWNVVDGAKHFSKAGLVWKPAAVTDIRRGGVGVSGL